MKPALSIIDKPDQYVSRKKVAELYDVSEDCLVKWNQRGYGPRPIKFGRRCVRFRLSDVIAFAEARQQAS